MKPLGISLYLYFMIATNNKNRNRTAGNHICIGTKDGIKSYYNWYDDAMIADKANAAGYHSKNTALGVIKLLKDQFPGYTWTTENDK